MYWITLSERSDEYELSIDGTPPLIEQNGWRFDCGDRVLTPVPPIDVPFAMQPDERMIDNVPAHGCRGLLINARVKAVFNELKLDNIQYFEARLVDEATHEVLRPYWIANVVGKAACVDHGRSELEYGDDGQIRFIDKLALVAMEGLPHGHIFRLAEFLPLLLVSEPLKNALIERGITGFTHYRPEDFSL